MPEFIRVVEEFVAPSIASIIDQDIYTTKPIDQGAGHVFYLLRIGYIAWNCQALAAHGPDFGSKLFDFALCAGSDCHICPCLGKRQGNAAADATASAGNDGSPS
jgi:hypothetical protein